jgi:hypothetical protein
VQKQSAPAGATGRQQTRTRRRVKKPVLVYTVSVANGGLAFATPERAALVARLQDAIECSRTWAEFRRRMPRSGYSLLIREMFDENGEPRPRGSDPFSADDVPGCCDGLYPPWLQQEMIPLLPGDILDGLDEQQDRAPGYDEYPHIDPEQLPEMIARLEQRGFVVKDGSHLGE